MRVVMIGPFGLRPKGTMSVRALPLAKALAARGHQLTVLLPPWDWPEDSGEAWTKDGVAIENITLPPAVPLLRHLITTWKLVKRTIALDPDIVHCFKPKSYAGLVAWFLWWFRRLGGTRVGLVVDTDDWEGAGGWNELAKYSWLQKRFFAWQEQWGLRHSDALTVASRALESIVWSLGVPRNRVKYVPNGVGDLRTGGGVRLSVHHEQRAQVHGGTVLLYTRFFAFALDRVVTILDLIHKARPKVRFLIVGKGLYGEEVRFMQLCRAAGLEPAIDYAGWVKAEALPGYFAQADVAMFPFDDTLINRTRCSVKLLDLLAAGVPVVAESVGQNAVIVEHGISGVLTPPGSALAMAEAVISLLGDANLRTTLTQGALRCVHERLAWRRLAEIAETAYADSRSSCDRKPDTATDEQ